VIATATTATAANIALNSLWLMVGFFGTAIAVTVSEIGKALIFECLLHRPVIFNG
jgi:hypothetical protein